MYRNNWRSFGDPSSRSLFLCIERGAWDASYSSRGPTQVPAHSSFQKRTQHHGMDAQQLSLPRNWIAPVYESQRRDRNYAIWLNTGETIAEAMEAVEEYAAEVAEGFHEVILLPVQPQPYFDFLAVLFTTRATRQQ